MPTIGADRPAVVLRPLQAGDAAAVEALASDFDVARWTARIPHPYPPGAAQGYLRDAVASDAAGDTLHRAITLAGDDRLVGVVSLVMMPPGLAELGYWVGRPAWGRGIAGQAAGAMVALARDHGLHRLMGKVMAGNDRSTGVLMRQGFVRDMAAIPEDAVRDGLQTPLHTFYLDLKGEGARP